MSGGSGANNSWTILSPEESAAETLRPLAEGKECHEESPSPAAGPASGAEPAQGHHVEDSPASKENGVTLNGDPGTNEDPPVSAAVTDAAASSSLEVSGSCIPHSDALSQSEGLPEDPAQSSPDSDSFSESYTHITASPDETPATLLNTETLGHGEVTQDDERVTEGATLHPLEGEGRQQEEEESDLSQRTPDIGKQADSTVDSEASEEKTGGDGEPEVRRRRSLLAALERIGRTEEEEEREEEFQLPQREDDSGLSLNKCILGAVILLGLGTIFLSESDYGTRELKDAEVPGKQEWLNPEVPLPPVDAGSSELLNKLSEGKEQISVLQAQLQAQQEELKVAMGQAAEGAKERLQWEEVEKENSRLKKEMASLPVLLKENERMKRELESVPALQKELETLRSTVTELKPTSAHEVGSTPVKSTTPPSSGHVEDSTEQPAEPAQKASKQPREKSKNVRNAGVDVGDRKEGKEREKWKTAEKNERKDGGKTEWKKQEHAKFDKEGEEKKAWKEKEWKKERASRGDDGKPWKDREGKKERTEKSERKEWKEETGGWKKTKREKVNEGKPWRGKEEKKEHGEKQKGKEHWKGEKEWKKGRDGYKEGGKEKWEKKDWKDKGEKKDGERKSGNGKEGKWKGERKQWDESSHRGKEGRAKDERKEWKDNERKSKNGKYEKEWKSNKDERKQQERKEEQWKRGRKDDKDKANSHKHKFNHGHRDQHHWVDRKPSHAQHRPSVGQPEYWLHQRDRLQHGSKPSQHCSSLETCAQAEGLLPVPFPDFHAILQTYLSKAGEAGVDASVRDELLKLTAEFFKDGVFVHDQMSFQEFAEDVGDVLEDMVEGDEDDDEEGEEEEDSAIENEMDMFEREVLKKFSVPGAGGKEDRAKGEWRKESVRGRG
ncbi:uncharacterized protein V6R79_021692 [Siganus canaliculatus]